MFSKAKSENTLLASSVSANNTLNRYVSLSIFIEAKLLSERDYLCPECA